MRAAFYCVADERYFLGAVGLVNSLRLVGHRERIFVLDCGLDDEQRELLAPEVELVAAPPGAPPWLRKTVAPLRRPADVAVLVDADMIVTRSLSELIERAAVDRVIAFRDRQQRFCGDWGELLGLGTARRMPYVSSGLVFCGGPTGRRVLELLDEHQRAVDFELTFWRRNVRGYPFLYADQDVLNAILATGDRAARAEPLEQRLAATPPYRGLRIADARTLRCAYRDVAEPYVVHQFVRKPWLEATYDGVYSRLLRRLLDADDVAVQPPRALIPLRMRTGALARAERARVNAADFLRWHLGDRLPRPIATRVENLRRPRETPSP